MNQAPKATNDASNAYQESDLIAHKESFYRELEKKLEQSRKIYKKSQIAEMISSLKYNKGNIHTKDQRVYYLLTTYQVLEISGIECLIKKLSDENDNVIKKVFAYEDLFDEIQTCHKAVGHGGIKKTMKECDKFWDNITQHMITLYNQFCQKKGT